MRDFACSVWTRGEDSLRSAGILLNTDPDSSASRAYYAAYHAVTAFFALRGQEFRKHTAVRAAVHRDLVKAGKWPASLGQDYDFLLSLREIGDYGGIARVTVAAATDALAAAQRILDAVISVCPELGHGQT